MGALLKRLWNDPAYFAAGVRGLGVSLGALLASGMLGTGSAGYWIGIVVVLASPFIPAGNKTAGVVDRMQALTPDELAQVRAVLLPPPKPAAIPKR